jgi:Pectate lyase superfamily protein
MPISRREFTQRTAVFGLLAPPALAAVSPRLVNVVDLGADPTGSADATAVVQSAIEKLAPTGGTIYFPAGTYRISMTLEWINPVKDRRSGILFLGDGMNSTTLRSAVASGPLLRVRGAPMQGPFSTTFFWGGGIQQLTLDGSGVTRDGHDAIEVMGWWYGELTQLRIRNFSRHGIRATTDLGVNSDPDFTASVLFVKAVWVERCGGWGFKDDGGVQGSPAWTWSHTVFVLCGEGGAYVQSSSHSFVRCSFSQCGWPSETAAPKLPGYGMYFDGAATATSRQWVEGCEFDNNYTAHVGLRFASTSSFVNNRFIFNDRQRTGKLCPPVGVQIGAGDARAAVHSVEFRQNFFRFDKGGDAVGFDWANTANMRDIAVQRNMFSDGSGGSLALTRYRGHDARNARTTNKYLVED